MSYAKQTAAAYTTAKLTAQLSSVRDNFMINVRVGKRNVLYRYASVPCLDWYTMAHTRHVCSGWDLLKATGRIALLVPASQLVVLTLAIRIRILETALQSTSPYMCVDGVSRPSA